MRGYWCWCWWWWYWPLPTVDVVAAVVVRKMRSLLDPALGRNWLCLQYALLDLTMLPLLLLLLLQLLQLVVDLQIRLRNRQKPR